MSREVVIKAENISKLYRLGQVGTGTLSHDLKRWWARTRGQEDPYLKIGMENDRTKKGESDYAWSLRDIHFEVQQGDTLGIIGKNGAGKSTLLKILSRVTTPTEGKIKIKGRIASLLEVGTGFHPELTGRENIYMNGAILGMTKKEITSKFDEIVSFSGVELYIDTPVKRYSSGMYVRLAFAVAAHLEPEILIVDEVLAVGDAEFQKKCLGKMGDVAKDGRTIIFVSHNMTAIHSLCNKTIMLDKGRMNMIGETNAVIGHYLNAYVNNSSSKIWKPEEAPGDSTARLHSVRLVNKELADIANSFLEDEVYLEIVYECLKQDEKLNLSISVMTAEDEYLFSSPSVSDDVWCNNPHPVGMYKSICKLPANFFNVANYKVHVLLVRNLSEIIAHAEDIVVMEKIDSGKHRKGYFGKWNGITRPLLDWNTQKLGGIKS
jgi:lipopolysaccharide transport system ATP-binding protein